MRVNRFMEEKYGLTGNPFLDDVARTIWLKTWVDREEQLEEWKRVISNAVSTNKNYLVFIIGDYGRGKTLSLLKIVEESKKYKSIMPVYLNFKGEERTKPGLDFIFRIFKNIDFKNLGKGIDKEDIINAINNLPNSFDEVQTILRKIYFGEQDSKLALYFIRGELKPSQYQLKQLGVLRKIESVDIAKEYLAGFLAFIKNLGFSTLLLAIDEFEYLFSLVPRSQHSIYLALLRGLYDFPLGISKHISISDIANLVFFIAISESGWNNLRAMEKREASIGGPIEALFDRTDAKTVLGRLEKHHARELIERRLRFNRIKGRYEDHPLIPFTEDFVDFVYDVTNGEPRAIIVVCGQVLDAGLEKGITILDKNFAKKALEERGII